MATGPIVAIAVAAVQASAAPSVPAAPDGPAMLAPALPAVVIPRATETCSEAVGEEIVVCGSRQADERHRLRDSGPAARDPDAPRGPLGFQISESVRMEVEPMQSYRSDGYVDRRIVARVRIAF